MSNAVCSDIALCIGIVTCHAHVVIVGGGFGGLSAAKALRNADVQVTLLDRRNHHVFQPLLYQVATATLSPGDIAAPIRWILRRARNMRVLLGEAARVDVAARRVELADGAALDYDYLIVASGSRHAYFGHEEWEQYAPGLKTLEDAITIRRRILIAFERAERETDPARQRELLTFVLVGGGPTGVELAGTLAEIARQTLRDEFRSIDTSRARIVLVEASRILATFPEQLQAAARESLTRLGIEIREGVAVTHIDAHGVMLGTERLDAGTIVWAAGVAASPLVATLGAPLDRAGRVARRARSLDSRTSRGLRGRGCGGLSPSRRQAASRRRADGDAGRGACGEEHPASRARRTVGAVRLSQSREHGDRRPRLRRSPTSHGRASPGPSAGSPGSSCTS